MNAPTLGFLRGLGYAILASLCTFVVANLGASGILPAGISAVIVAIAAAIEHNYTQ
jgi:hypothetical protein